ncbi:MAG: TadE/TadG family type IV pilus assembly protein [Pseudomonadota bacterium]|jgi:Flp pilus assembly protein TadG
MLRRRPSSPPSKKRRGFRRDQRGATALEFALIATPFIFMLMCVFDLGFIYLAQVSLDSATAQTARTIRTGQLQKAGGATAATFASSICSNMSWAGTNCSSNLSVNVQVFTSFSSASSPNPVTNGQFSNANLTFNTGNAGDIVLVTAYYQWTPLTPFLNQGLHLLNNGATLLTSSAAFRNEPYS